jgi:hypothetical protein
LFLFRSKFAETSAKTPAQVMDRVMFPQPERDLARSGFRSHLLKATTLKLMGDERIALLVGQRFQGIVQFFEQDASRVARLRPGML